MIAELIRLKIKDARLSAGLTQQRMSEVFEIPKRTIENWEAGVRKLVIRELERIAEENNK